MPSNSRSTITYQDALQDAADIERQGYGALPGFVSQDELEPLRSIARVGAQQSRGESFYLTRLTAVSGTVLAELAQSTCFKNFCENLYELATGDTAPEEDFYFSFRCLQGASGQRDSYQFHYDSHIVTALLPVEIPESGPKGDLILFPHVRPIRRHYYSSLLDKLVLSNKLSQTTLRGAARRGRLGAIAIRMQPGTVYFFWGYRSIHANEPCEPDKLRATALFHYGDRHRNSRLQALSRYARERNT
jgi:hypothetical protein